MNIEDFEDDISFFTLFIFTKVGIADRTFVKQSDDSIVADALWSCVSHVDVLSPINVNGCLSCISSIAQRAIGSIVCCVIDLPSGSFSSVKYTLVERWFAKVAWAFQKLREVWRRRKGLSRTMHITV